MVDHAAKIIHDQIFSDGANTYRTLNSASQMRKDIGLKYKAGSRSLCCC
jgi:hypothetical protein